MQLRNCVQTSATLGLAWYRHIGWKVLLCSDHPLAKSHRSANCTKVPSI